MLRHPIIVYGIRENNIKTILHPNCLSPPLHVFTYEAFQSDLLIPIYGVKCSFETETGKISVSDSDKAVVKELFERLKKSGKNVDLGFFPVYIDMFYIKYKHYFLE